MEGKCTAGIETITSFLFVSSSRLAPNLCGFLRNLNELFCPSSQL
jgi:hypothetical protein